MSSPESRRLSRIEPAKAFSLKQTDGKNICNPCNQILSPVIAPSFSLRPAPTDALKFSAQSYNTQKEARMFPKVINMPVFGLLLLAMPRNPRRHASRTKRAAHVNIVPRNNFKTTPAADLRVCALQTSKHQRVCSWSRFHES